MPNVIEITDFSAPELDVYARLTEAQLLNRHKIKEGLFIAESPKVIERALDAGCEPVSFLCERYRQVKSSGYPGSSIAQRAGESCRQRDKGGEDTGQDIQCQPVEGT